MIPWANFDNGTRQDLSGDVQLQLHEHWLAWIQPGPSMTSLFLESPMLEIAHERQFVTSQTGGQSAGFESEHTRRMQDCLRQLDDYFCGFATTEPCYPGSPHRADLSCCWAPEVALDAVSPLRLSPEEPISPRSQPRSDHVMTSTSTLAVPSQVKAEDDDLPDDADENLEQLLQNLPRAGTVLPLHGARAKKPHLQRRKYDSKLATDVLPTGKKRNSEWVVDEDEDDATLAQRHQSIASLRTSHDRNVTSGPSRVAPHREET